MELWFATSNKGKISEAKQLLDVEVKDLDLHVQSEIAGFTPRPENGKSFVENARIKARTLHSVKPGVWVLGEDSGLVVEGLGGLPGIHSARYAGEKASDNENTAKLLKMISLRSSHNRKAHFVCELIVYAPSGEEMHFSGKLEGSISSKPAGLHGFGYDPVFVPEGQALGQTKTLAELGPAFKNQNSHRAQAIKAFLNQLKRL